MDISVIAKRIDNGIPNGGQGAYAHDLLEYMTNPDSRHDEPLGVAKSGEKYVAVLCENFWLIRMLRTFDIKMDMGSNRGNYKQSSKRRNHHVHEPSVSRLRVV